MMKIQLDHIQREHAIRMKAISDREAAELDFEQKRYCLLRSQMMSDSRGGYTGEALDQTRLDVGSDHQDERSSQKSVPFSFEYNSSVGNVQIPVGGSVLTHQQICARQVIPPDLPIFTGDPEDWPVFYSQYNNTTSACGYSYAENLIRLQRYIKGKALEYVRSRLLLPELVPKVIETLEMLYGRPTVLINSLISKVQSIPAPEMERLETIIDYGMAIQNLFDHLTALDQTTHLQNPTLLHELEAKLPAQMQLEWIRFRREHGPSSLKTLHEFMSEVVETACEVTFVGSKLQSCRARNDGYDSDETVATNSEVGNNSYCFVCQQQNHCVEDCNVFRSYEVCRRWRLVGDLKLCRCCLNRHTARVCRRACECGIDRCHLLHHPLLHQNKTR